MITGSELNKLGKKFCILTTSDCIHPMHNGSVYKEGLNILHFELEFNKLNCQEEKNEKTYDKYGLYFCDINHIQCWPPCYPDPIYGDRIMNYIYDVVIPDDARIIIGKYNCDSEDDNIIVNDGDGYGHCDGNGDCYGDGHGDCHNDCDIVNAWRLDENMYKTDKMILSNKRRLWTDEYCCRIMVMHHFWSLKYVENQTEELCRLAVKYDSLAIQYVKNINHTLCKILLDENSYILPWIYEYYYKCIDYNLDNILEICNIAINKNPYLIQFIFETFANIIDKNNKYQILILAIKKDYNILKLFNIGNDIKLCESIVQINGLALQYIENPNIDICKYAVKQNGLALQYIENQTKELCELAIKQNTNAQLFCKNK
jgi:hypothetical protein